MQCGHAGAWQLRDGMDLRWSEGDNWVGDVELPGGAVYEYKYVLLDAASGHALSWQRGNNSVLALKAGEDHVEARTVAPAACLGCSLAACLSPASQVGDGGSQTSARASASPPLAPWFEAHQGRFAPKLLDVQPLHAGLPAVPDKLGSLPQVYDNWEGQPGAAVVAAGASVTRERRLLDWATEMEALVTTQVRASRIQERTASCQGAKIGVLLGGGSGLPQTCAHAWACMMLRESRRHTDGFRWTHSLLSL